MPFGELLGIGIGIIVFVVPLVLLPVKLVTTIIHIFHPSRVERLSDDFIEDERARERFEALSMEYDFLTSQLDQLEELQRITEYNLQRGLGKEETLRKRMLSLDKQIYNTMKKRMKIENILKDVE